MADPSIGSSAWLPTTMSIRPSANATNSIEDQADATSPVAGHGLPPLGGLRAVEAAAGHPCFERVSLDIVATDAVLDLAALKAEIAIR
ncbi:hypothetical protein [Elioraea sp.]|uniref:hypothetical protein n=1 Tax=Elioraea sp. TaxID=2185103 RepID=UPI00307E2551